MDHLPNLNNPKTENPVPNTKWEAKVPIPLSKEHFDLQLEFAKEIQRKTGDNLFYIIGKFTSVLRLYAFNYKNFEFIDIKPGVTEENIAEIAYKEYLTSTSKKPAEYHTEDSTTFGCFSYNQDKETKEVVHIHFDNEEFDSIGPLDKSKIEMRKKEMTDVLTDIKNKYPDTKEVRGLSWLYNLPSYKRLFPLTYIDNLKTNEELGQWKRGATIWGQFMDNQLKLKKEMADEFLKRVKELPADALLSEIFKKGPPLLPPLETSGPIKDFYDMYGIK